MSNKAAKIKPGNLKFGNYFLRGHVEKTTELKKKLAT